MGAWTAELVTGLERERIPSPDVFQEVDNVVPVSVNPG